MAQKIFVKVVARFDKSGKITPLSLTWENGRTFEIDQILDVCQAASLKAGGQGIRYTVKISGHIRYLFFEDPAWFVEGKNP